MRRRRTNLVLFGVAIVLAWVIAVQVYGVRMLTASMGVPGTRNERQQGHALADANGDADDRGDSDHDDPRDAGGGHVGRTLGAGSLLRVATLPGDASGAHRILHGYAAPDAAGTGRVFAVDRASFYSAPWGIDIAMHATANHLHNVIDVARGWDGEISMAVFDPEVSANTLALIDGVRACSPDVASKVTFHMVYPRDIAARKKTIRLLRKKHRVADGVPTTPLPLDECRMWAIQYGVRASGAAAGDLLDGRGGRGAGDRRQGLADISEDNEVLMERGGADGGNYALTFPYPNNLLRNVARRGTRSAFVLAIDADILPAPGLQDLFLSVVRLGNDAQGGRGREEGDGDVPNGDEDGGLERRERAKFEQKIFVLPAFEKSENRAFPRKFEDILAGLREGTVRPFYNATCWKCQQHTDYALWQEESADPSVLYYQRPWKDPWEPFYIGPRSVPLYDERFRQYGFNRISQVCEAWVAGFDFHVLTRAFVVHDGFKEPGQFHAQKNAENDANRLHFRAMKQELKTRYPQSRRRCY